MLTWLAVVLLVLGGFGLGVVAVFLWLLLMLRPWKWPM
jgi:hypothetical protein